MSFAAIKHFLQSIHTSYVQAANEDEDRIVRPYLEQKSHSPQTYLEIGSGTGRFVLDVHARYPLFEITCVEINTALAQKTVDAGLKTLQMDVRDLSFSDSSFDVIHCSHLIEHLAYPDIAHFLDKVSRMLKPEGYLILRSPLLSRTFYNDLDHIRPYPPQSITNFFGNEQQQLVGSTPLRVKETWFRTPPIAYSFPRHERLSRNLNLFFKWIWMHIPAIHGKADGYVLILQR